MDFGCSDAFTKGDRNTEWNLLSSVKVYSGDKADSSPGLEHKCSQWSGKEMAYFRNSALLTAKSLWSVKVFHVGSEPHVMSILPQYTCTHTQTHTVLFHLPACGKTSYLHNCTSWVIKVQTHWNFSEVLGKYLVWNRSWNAGPGPDTSWWSPAWGNLILI